jgi:tetratricopeptide (TPR) repeat protein
LKRCGSSPRDTFAFVWAQIAGSAKLFLGADEEAVAWIRRAIESNRNFALSHFFLAATLALLDRLDEAGAEAGLALDPRFTLAHFRASAPSDNPTFLAQRELAVEGMQGGSTPDTTKAETYFDHALAVARQQQAKSWELRAAMSMARLWRDQGKWEEARELLAPVYGWFTEGFETRDLKEAKTLLDELAA